MSSAIRDGVALAYDDVGEGPQSFLFIHGAYADRSAFQAQVRAFSATHRVVSVDMRGHGESSKPSGPYRIDDWVADTAWLCERLRIEKPIIVGHSMGGLVAVEIAAQHGDLPRAVVTLDSPSPIPGWSAR